MLIELRKFLLRGNVVDLAVAVIIGAAFTGVVTAFVEDLVTPLIAAAGGEPDFSAITFSLNGSVFKIGHFINAVLSFLIIGTVVFFFLVQPVNYMITRSRREPSADPTTKKCGECLSEVPIDARRCAFCAQPFAT